MDGEKGGGQSLTNLDQDEDAPDDRSWSDKAVYGSRKQSNNEANKDPNSPELRYLPNFTLVTYLKIRRF